MRTQLFAHWQQQQLEKSNEKELAVFVCATWHFACRLTESTYCSLSLALCVRVRTNELFLLAARKLCTNTNQWTILNKLLARALAFHSLLAQNTHTHSLLSINVCAAFSNDSSRARVTSLIKQIYRRMPITLASGLLFSSFVRSFASSSSSTARAQ